MFHPHLIEPSTTHLAMILIVIVREIFVADVQTNAHVISDMLPRLGDRMTEGAAPAGPIICTLHDGRIFEGTLTGYDR